MRFFILVLGVVLVPVQVLAEAAPPSSRFSASLDYLGNQRDDSGNFVVETSNGYLVAATTKSNSDATVQDAPVWLVPVTREVDGIWKEARGSLYSGGEVNAPLYFRELKGPAKSPGRFLLLAASNDSTGLVATLGKRYWALIVDENGVQLERHRLGTFMNVGLSEFTVNGATQLEDGRMVFYGKGKSKEEKCLGAVAVIANFTGQAGPVKMSEASGCDASGQHESLQAFVQSEQGDFLVAISRYTTVHGDLTATGRIENRGRDGIKKVSSVSLNGILPLRPTTPIPNSSGGTPIKFEQFLETVDPTVMAVSGSTLVISGTASRRILVSKANFFIKPGEEPLKYEHISMNVSVDPIWVASLDISGSQLTWIQRYSRCWSERSGTAVFNSIGFSKNSSDIFLAGACTDSQRKLDPFLVTRLSANGDMLWSRLFFHHGNMALDSTARNVIEDRSGDIVAVGSVRRQAGKDLNVFLMKTDPDGFIP